jgi:DNA-binding transcriptional regulator GbsR (MarR family)
MEKKTEVKQNTKLKDLFLNAEGGFIPVPRAVTRILGFNATGLLEELCDRYDYYLETEQLNEYEEFYYTISDIEINAGLSRTEQETAIKKLKEYGFIKSIKNRGIPRKRYFKLSDNIPEIFKDIIIESNKIKADVKEKAVKDVERYKNPSNLVESPVGRKHTDCIVENLQTVSQKTDILYCKNPTVINNYNQKLKTKTNTKTIFHDTKMMGICGNNIPYEEQKDIFAEFIDSEDTEKEWEEFAPDTSDLYNCDEMI